MNKGSDPKPLSAEERAALMYDWIFDEEGYMTVTIQECRNYIAAQLVAYRNDILEEAAKILDKECKCDILGGCNCLEVVCNLKTKR